MHKYPLILLHGWGFSSRIWQPLLKQLHTEWPGPVYPIDLPGFGAAFHEPCTSLDQTLEFILEQLPAQSVLCGWSLGGMLATQIAARWPERVSGLVTLGSNLHFTQQGSWPGMPLDDYQQFCERFSLQPEKTWRRFLTLQTRGEAQAERHNITVDMLAEFDDMESDTAFHLLKLLGEMDNRTVFSTLTMPGLHCFGEHDSITPVAVTEQLQVLNPRQAITVFPASSHALCISRVNDIASQLRRFAGSLAAHISSQSTTLNPTITATPPLAINRQTIARSFSEAAQHYDNAAALQRAVGDTLLAHMATTHCEITADIGCGTGYITQKMQARATHVIAVDIAHGMALKTHHNSHSSAGANVSSVQADMAQLPLANHSVDLLVSNLALQWSHNPTAVFREWRRVLNERGELHFSTFLPGTLQELAQAWQSVDHHTHVNTFTSLDEVLHALHAAGFTSVSAEQEQRVVYFPCLRTLAQSLKTIGAHNMNANRSRGLTGKKRWQQLQTEYEKNRRPEGLPVSYEVLYVSAC